MLNRRDFLTTSVASGIGLALAPLASAQDVKPQVIAEGKPLKPPADGLVKVAVAVSKGTTWIDFVGPLATFESWFYDPVEKKHKPAFKTFLVSDTLDVTEGLTADYTFETAPEAQVILVPAQQGSDGLIQWLKKVQPATDVTMSVCIGARHLAAAGLLDGIRATTHHKSIEDFKKRFPKVDWVSGMRYVEGERISTGGGLTAGIDLGLRIVERYYGREKALGVAEHLEYQSTSWIV